MDPTIHTRRNFIINSAMAAASLPLAGLPVFGSSNRLDDKLNVSIFSKHLQFLDYRDMASMAAQLGFDGVDLTVRPGGHVLPERVEQDLPVAVDALENAGLRPLMMATGVNDPANPVDQNVLKTASKLGIKYYRMAYFRYTEDGSIPDDISRFQQQAKALGDLNRELGLIGCYQNHAGNYVGASIFELYEIFKQADKQSTGVQYDIRHATVEGGRSWETGLRLIYPGIKTMALKDFIWKQIDGRWETVNVPIGQGMVDFKQYFGLLKKYQVQVPASLHLEYPIGGAEHGHREISVKPDLIYEAMSKDLSLVRKMWAEA